MEHNMSRGNYLSWHYLCLRSACIMIDKNALNEIESRTLESNACPRKKAAQNQSAIVERKSANVFFVISQSVVLSRNIADA